MSIEIKINNRIAKVELVEKDENKAIIKIDNRLYKIDVNKIDKGIYLILHKNKTHKFSIIQNKTPNKLVVSTEEKYFNVSIIDAETRYLESRKGSSAEDTDNIISSPMPGKVVKITVKKGDKVKKGDTLIIISAMKMESEYKSSIDGIVKKIKVKENDTIEGNQPLIYIK